VKTRPPAKRHPRKRINTGISEASRYIYDPFGHSFTVLKNGHVKVNEEIIRKPTAKEVSRVQRQITKLKLEMAALEEWLHKPVRSV
jgi:hypothetical protein